MEGTKVGRLTAAGCCGALACNEIVSTLFTAIVALAAMQVRVQLALRGGTAGAPPTEEAYGQVPQCFDHCGDPTSRRTIMKVCIQRYRRERGVVGLVDGVDREMDVT